MLMATDTILFTGAAVFIGLAKVCFKTKNRRSSPELLFLVLSGTVQRATKPIRALDGKSFVEVMNSDGGEAKPRSYSKNVIGKFFSDEVLEY